jgi:hypothetical protein
MDKEQRKEGLHTKILSLGQQLTKMQTRQGLPTPGQGLARLHLWKSNRWSEPGSQVPLGLDRQGYEKLVWAYAS